MSVNNKRQPIAHTSMNCHAWYRMLFTVPMKDKVKRPVLCCLQDCNFVKMYT